MDDGVPPAASLGPCRECGRSLPRATMRYCVHCGADMADVTGATDVRGAGSGSAGGSWTRESGTAGGPGAQEPASDWSTGEFRAPSPLDGVPLLPPLVPPEPLTRTPAEAPFDASSGPWSPAAWYTDADPPTRAASGPAAEGVVPGPVVSGVDADPAGLAPWPPVPLPSPDVPPADAAWSPERGWPTAAPPAAASLGSPWPEGVPGNQVLAPLPYLPLPAGRRSRREPLMLIVGAIMILFVVSAGGLFWLNGRGGDPGATHDGGPVPAASVPMSVSSAASGPTASSPAAGSTGSGDATTGVGADVLPPAVAASGSSPDVVRSLDALLERSAEARGDVASTAVALQSCRMPATAAEATFRRARDDRNELASEASALSGSGADQPVGDAVRAFIALQKSSAQADDALAAWASEVATAGCSGQARRTATLDLANRYSGDATAAKVRFVTLWNPIAVAHGLSERSADAI